MGMPWTRKLYQKTFQWFVNLNDQTNEGLIRMSGYGAHNFIRRKPGPFDTKWIFSLLKNEKIQNSYIRIGSPENSEAEV